MSDKSGAPILTQPLISPSPAAPHHPRIVSKSKSLTTSMDKLVTSGGRALSRNSSSRESSFAGSSRGSTPISSRSAIAPRPASRRSVHSTRSPQPPECHTIDPQERAGKSASPTGSDASLHSSQSINSSTQSVNSSQSIHSVASSNASVKSKASGRSFIPGRPHLPQCPRASSEPPTLSPPPRKSPSKRVSKSGSAVATADTSAEGRKSHLPPRRRSTSASLNSSSGDVRSNETSSPQNMSSKCTPPRANPPPPQNSSNIKPNVGTMSNRKPLRVFNSYMSLFQVQEKLKKGEVIEGVLRINPKSYEDAYISAPEGGMDIFIGGVRDRNTALHGDIVAAMINPPEEWKVLYPQLEAYLKEHSDLKALVYMPLKPDISNADNAFTTTTILSSTTIRNHSTTSKSEKVTKNEEQSSKSQSKEMPKKKKRHRRGKKKRQKDPCSPIALAAEESCSGPSGPVKDTFKVVADTPAPLLLPPSPDRQGLTVVAPHELSECDLTDNESCDSLAESMENLLNLHDSSASNIPPNAVSTILPQMPLSNSDPFIKKNPHASKKVQKQKLIHKDPCLSPSEQFSGTPKLQVNEHYQSKYKNKEGKQAEDKCIETVANPDPTQDIVTESHSQGKPTVLQVQRLIDWKKFVQRTAVVVNILERKHPMVAAGIIKQFADKNPHFVLFSPFDPRIPRVKIQMHKCPPDFLSRPTDYTKKIFLAQITEWNDPKFAFGDLVYNIGEVGDITAELESLLLENNINSSDFPPSVYDSLPTLPWSIPQDELKHRTDLRSSTIFTIDPPSARDLDDALSCLPLPSGNFRVGVHIADVSYFVEPNTPLDNIASDRGNSFYLVHKVIPMLPSILCEKLCSLNPGEDRLAFSIIWELTPEGTIKGEWVGRTIIRSCAKFSYDHVQEMIESPKREFSPESFPPIASATSIAEIATTVNNLNKIAIHLRKKRIAAGALRLDQVKLGFTLPPDSLIPSGVYIQKIKESNKLVEEFMLMANVAIAQRIYRAFPKLALLRLHPPPHDTQMDAVVNLLDTYGVHLNSQSSKMLSQSIESYVGSDPMSIARMQLIVNLCSKPMHYALYVCAGQSTSMNFHHYALNVPLYTHFTSPIRRYADIIVHRLLASSLDRVRYPIPYQDVSTLVRKSEICNDKKQASKIIQEVNCELFLAAFIRSVGEIVESGIIIGVLDRSVDVMICKFGMIKRCYMEKLPLVSSHFIEKNNKKSLIIEWECDESANLPRLTQALSYFDCVTVLLRPFENEALKFNAFLVRPNRSLD